MGSVDDDFGDRAGCNDIRIESWKRTRCKCNEESGWDLISTLGVFPHLARMDQWKDYCQQRAVRIGLDRHVAIQFADPLSHPGAADSSLASAFVQLTQGLGRHAVSVI